jgi:hypothetical protein
MAELRVKSTGTLKLFESDNTSSVTIASPASLGADRTITLPDASVTLASGTMLATDGSGASLTALNASELGSGTVPTARLGSGTASSSTVLYGDQTYKTEPSGFDVTSITGQTALDAIPDNDDELVLSDAGTLKKIDYKYLAPVGSIMGFFSHTTQHTITDDTYTKILLSSADMNRGLTFASNQVTIPSGEDGDYYVQTQVQFNSYANGGLEYSTVRIDKNGSPLKYFENNFQQADGAGSSKKFSNNGSWVLRLNATDYLEIFVALGMEQTTPSYRATNYTTLFMMKLNNE